MHDHTFAHYLAAWLDPYELLKAAKRYDHERNRALAPAGLLISSGRLKSGDEANFAAMVQSYVRGFRVPPAMIDLVRLWAGSSGPSDEAWNWLRDLSLSATVHSYSHGTSPPSVPATVILNVEERDVVTDIIRQPVLALLDLVDRLAVGWRKYAALGASIYHMHSMPDRFYAYVDSQVASAYLNLVDPGLLAEGVPKFRYRAVTVAGISEDDRFWDVAQDTARRMAASTHDPIPKKGR
jgi:hypothetical protein